MDEENRQQYSVEKIGIEDLLTSHFRAIAKYYQTGNKIRFINTVDSTRIYLCNKDEKKKRPNGFDEAYDLWQDLRDIANKRGLLFTEIVPFTTWDEDKDEE